MIPKKIHFCWFGGNPLSDLHNKCIASWKKYLPDYEIVRWDESNFDIDNCPSYVKEAYSVKKWAFVVDYVRLKIMYDYGGVYFDTDVEVIKPFDDILSKGNYLGCEAINDIAVNPGLGFAMEPGNIIIKELLDEYNQDHFLKPDGTFNYITSPSRTTRILKNNGLLDIKEIQKVKDISIYPTDYFCPRTNGLLKKTTQVTSNTHSIHHSKATWAPWGARIRGKIYYILSNLLGERTAIICRKIFGRKRKIF